MHQLNFCCNLSKTVFTIPGIHRVYNLFHSSSNTGFTYGEDSIVAHLLNVHVRLLEVAVTMVGLVVELNFEMAKKTR